MKPLAAPLAILQDVNRTAPFNEWAKFEVTDAREGHAELRMPWRSELAQYSGFLLAGVVSALIDTVCGFAAATVAGRVLASHNSVSFLRPAIGQQFIAKGKVIKAGNKQIFASAELFAENNGELSLVATGETILVSVSETL